MLNLLKDSWHKDIQEMTLSYLKTIKFKTLIDLGFGVPALYVERFALKKQIYLIDICSSALVFSNELLKNYKNINLIQEDMQTISVDLINNKDVFILLDSLEHTNNPLKTIRRLTKYSKKSAKFIMSLPIVEKIPSHNIEWKTIIQAKKWLKDNNLKIIEEKTIKPNPKADLFASNLSKPKSLLVLLEKY
jgi:2-polyprenyl-3-methyl-5-hydroxy-6-metoxy-1,4-benzoquinol methylase